MYGANICLSFQLSCDLQMIFGWDNEMILHWKLSKSSFWIKLDVKLPHCLFCVSYVWKTKFDVKMLTKGMSFTTQKLKEDLLEGIFLACKDF